MKLFDPPCRNTEICPPWKSCLECKWRVCVSSTDALVLFLLFLFQVTTSPRSPSRSSPNLPNQLIFRLIKHKPIIELPRFLTADIFNLFDLCQLKISKICHCISLFTDIVNFPVSFCSSDVIVTCLLTRQQLFAVWSNVDSTKSP